MTSRGSSNSLCSNSKRGCSCMRNNTARWMNSKWTFALATLLSDSICLHPVSPCIYNWRTSRHIANLHLSNRTLTQFYSYRYQHLTSSTTTLHRFKISGVKQSALVTDCHRTQRSLLAVAHYNVLQGTWISNSKHFRCTNILSVFFLDMLSRYASNWAYPSTRG